MTDAVRSLTADLRHVLDARSPELAARLEAE
jgi:hypothetical protein